MSSTLIHSQESLLTVVCSCARANALLHAVSAERPKLAAALSVFTQVPGTASKVRVSPTYHARQLLTPPPSPSSAQDWDDATITVMDSRLNTLLALLHPSEGDASTDTVTESPSARTTGPDERASSSLPAGWRKLSERDGWRPAPIGVYVRCG